MADDGFEEVEINSRNINDRKRQAFSGGDVGRQRVRRNPQRGASKPAPSERAAMKRLPTKRGR